MIPTLNKSFFAVASMLLLATVAVRAQVNKTSDDLDGKAEYAYVLTLEKFNKLEDVREALGEWLENNEPTSKRLQADKSFLDGTLTERTRILDMKYPEFAAIIRRHGMSTQEYLLGTQVMVHALLLLDAKKDGEVKKYAKNVNPANLAFVEKHVKEIRENIRVRM